MRSRLVPLLALSLALSLAGSACPAATIYVDQRSPGPAHDGTTWATAFTNVQAAVDAAQPGDEVWVAAGAYHENIFIKNGRALYGGFDGTESARDQRDWSHNVTVLDGGAKNTVIIITAGTGSTEAVTVDGFTIRNGATTGGGGGLRVYGDATIANNIVIGNTAISGGQGWGGGLGAQGGNVYVVNNLIAGNVSDQGAGIYSSGGHVTIVNSTVIGNDAVNGAVYRRLAGQLAITNSLITHNSSGVFREYGTVSLRHCNIYGNSAYNFQGLPDPTGTDGNISEDPKLSSFRSGFHLQPGSPCIDAGDDALVSPGEMDLYGKPRLLGAHVDIGADESDGTLYPPPDPRIWRLSANGDDANDGASWARAKKTLRLALLYAEAGDEVWVAAGTYTGVATLKSGVGLYGGFAGGETSRGERDPAANVTVCDGILGRNAFGTSAGTVLTLAADASPETVVDGFTIQNGEGVFGAGISILGGSPTITGNTFRDNGRSSLAWDNTTITCGGGLYVGGGRPTITGNSFTGNAATNGGGLYVEDGTPTVLDNTFSENAASYGGGICVNAGAPLIASNSISGNYALYGAGVFAMSGLIRDNLIESNQVTPDRYYTGGAGGIYVGENAVAIRNRILRNTSKMTVYGSGGGGAIVLGVLLDNLLQENEGTWANSVVCERNSVVSRNTITSARWGDSMVYVYGGSITDNLMVTGDSEFGLFLNYSPNPLVIANNTIVNTGPTTSGTRPRCGIYNQLDHSERVTLVNNIVVGWGKAGETDPSPTGTPAVFTISHNDAYGNTDNALTLPGTSSGNISLGPLFLDAANGDYRLREGSPCIDAGDDATVLPEARDAEGRPRIAGVHVDIGAYEYGSPLYTLLDAADVLRIAAGLSTATPADVARLDVVLDDPGPARLSIEDATRIARWLLN